MGVQQDEKRAALVNHLQSLMPSDSPTNLEVSETNSPESSPTTATRKTSPGSDRKA